MDTATLNFRTRTVGSYAFLFSSFNFHLMYFEGLLSDSYKFGFVVPFKILILTLSCNIIYHWFIVLVLKSKFSDINRIYSVYPLVYMI